MQGKLGTTTLVLRCVLLEKREEGRVIWDMFVESGFITLHLAPL
jgi:hypothetical protein